MTGHDGTYPLRADAHDRTGQRLEITAGVRDGEVLVAIGRPGHPPLVELAATAEETDDIADMVHALQRAVASQS